MPYVQSTRCSNGCRSPISNLQTPTFYPNTSSLIFFFPKKSLLHFLLLSNNFLISWLLGLPTFVYKQRSLKITVACWSSCYLALAWKLRLPMPFSATRTPRRTLERNSWARSFQRTTSLCEADVLLLTVLSARFHSDILEKFFEVIFLCNFCVVLTLFLGYYDSWIVFVKFC